MFSLQDKVALITGASQGIGRATTLALVVAGAKVAVAARNGQKLATLVREIEAAGGTALAVPMDVADPVQVKTAFPQILTKFGKLDILVNNAAITYFIPVADFPEKRFKLMMEVQVYAPFHLSQLVLPSMKERHTGWIINISSGAGIHPKPPYDAASRKAPGVV